jgi:hypothetical protein
MRSEILKKILFIFFLLFLFALADLRYLMRVDHYRETQENIINLENQLANLKVQHSREYNLDELRKRILADESLKFRPATEEEKYRWNP